MLLKRFFSDSIFTDPSSAAKMKPSKTFGFNPCSGGACGNPAVRPLVDTGAMVFVVFGILGVNRTERRDNHVIGDMVSAPPLSAYLNNHIWSKAEPDLKMIFSCCWRGVKLSPKGSIILDPDFDIFQEMGHLCKMCKAISANRQLVKPGGAQCLPSGNFYFKQWYEPYRGETVCWGIDQQKNSLIVF